MLKDAVELAEAAALRVEWEANDGLAMERRLDRDNTLIRDLLAWTQRHGPPATRLLAETVFGPLPAATAVAD